MRAVQLQSLYTQSEIQPLLASKEVSCEQNSNCFGEYTELSLNCICIVVLFRKFATNVRS